MGHSRRIALYDDEGEVVLVEDVILSVVVLEDETEVGMDQHAIAVKAMRAKYPHWRVRCYDPDRDDAPYLPPKEEEMIARLLRQEKVIDEQNVLLEAYAAKEFLEESEEK